MKATQVTPPTVKEEVKTCVICNRPVKGYYGTWCKTGTCSRICEDEQKRRVGSSMGELELRLQEYHAVRTPGGRATPKM